MRIPHSAEEGSCRTAWLEEVEEGRTLSSKFDRPHWVTVLGPDVLVKLLLGSFQLPASVLLQKLMGMFKESPDEVSSFLLLSFSASANVHCPVQAGQLLSHLTPQHL